MLETKDVRMEPECHAEGRMSRNLSRMSDYGQDVRRPGG
jgi:hypothetical protein